MGGCSFLTPPGNHSVQIDLGSHCCISAWLLQRWPWLDFSIYLCLGFSICKVICAFLLTRENVMIWVKAFLEETWGKKNPRSDTTLVSQRLQLWRETYLMGFLDLILHSPLRGRMHKLFWPISWDCASFIPDLGSITWPQFTGRLCPISEKTALRFTSLPCAFYEECK